MVTRYIFFSFINSVNSFSINRQLLFLNQWKRKNELRNNFKINSLQKNVPDTGIVLSHLSQDQMQFFVTPEVIFQGCLSDFILGFLKSIDEAVSENVYIGYNILYYGIYFY